MLGLGDTELNFGTTIRNKKGVRNLLIWNKNLINLDT